MDSVIPEFNDQDFKLTFTGEFRRDPQGNMCPVLDVSKLDFEQAPLYQKKPTKVIRVCEKGIFGLQRFANGLETYPREAKIGEALFINGVEDTYVPTSKDGGRLMFDDLEANGYDVISKYGDQALVKSPPAKLLVGVVNQPICLKCVWGDDDVPANHQFLYPGAVLKQKPGKTRVTGMDKKGFEKWGLIKGASNIPKPTLKSKI
ncbi:MAG: hypothetical protein CMP22_08210 [Rickettsiales bacterium]|nr:hypothetical protein [Rickettsiales bacterium]